MNRLWNRASIAWKTAKAALKMENAMPESDWIKFDRAWEIVMDMLDGFLHPKTQTL